jgi:hypothetical protein
MLDHLDSDFERAEYLQNLLVSRATGGGTGTDEEYQHLRQHFLSSSELKARLPEFVRTRRDLSQFWQFIKHKLGSYQERREFLWESFRPLLEHLEGIDRTPADTSISSVLKQFDEVSVHAAWSRAVERKKEDPEGAITAARTLLETVCKHILDECSVQYDSNKVEIHELYKLVAIQLRLSPSQHTEEVFRQILGGCSAIVTGLGTLRNRLGDAHGKGKRPIRPAPRHAELAVNLSGSVALFLVTTWQEHKHPNS